jgi:iron complex outermembrane receptor protein
MAQNTSGIKGTLSDIEEIPVSGATISVDGNKISETDKQGFFEISGLSEGSHKVTITSPKFNEYSEIITLGAYEVKEIKITLYSKGDIDGVTILGNRQTEGMDMITRLPVSSRELPQNISVVTEEIIAEQGALSLTDVTQNVSGVTLFGSYGGVRESMSIRGYRGTPVLKNGVQVDSDFRTASVLTDMQGIESVQVLKGSAAITQGIGDGLGSPGGVINIVTKTPKFIEKGNISIRTGSWGLFRPSLDYQTVLDKKQTIAFRINADYERADSYKSFVKKDHIYVNPSFEWRPDDKTRIILEMDYMNDNTTPDNGTVNLAADSTYALYTMPHNKFMGFSTDNVHNQTTTYGTRIYRKINDKLTLRGTYSASSYQAESTAASLSKVPSAFSKRNRTLSKSDRDDKNSVIQLDLVGKDINTGKIKHTFQTGLDFKKNSLSTTSYKLVGKTPIDQIDVLDPTIPTFLPEGYSFEKGASNPSTSSAYGLMAQDIITFNSYVKAMLGVRYNHQISESSSSSGKVTGDAWDPFFGIMVNPVKNINIFGSYTTTSSLRSATNKDINGKEMGASVSNQWEFGFKSSWLDEKLYFTATYFNIKNSDLQYGITDGVSSNVLYYILAGDLKRSGIELEVTGKILPNLSLIAGYSYLDSRYEDSPSFVDGSRPMNAPRNTANGWAQYLFDKGTLKNLSLGLGVYYVGSRPVNEWSTKTSSDGHGTEPGTKPFLMREYTTVNAQAGYTYKDIGLRVFFNNIFDALGYNSYYRGGYINQINPRNFGVQLSYNF